jgi:arylsulfatase A-like enzyme
MAGYDTAIVGKWDVGMATEGHSPSARGFVSWLGYWHHSNDYWTHGREVLGKGCARPLGTESELW